LTHFFFIAFLNKFFFSFVSFNITLFDNLASWYYSNAFTLLSQLGHKFCILIRVVLDWVFFFYLFKLYFFLNFHPSTFYLLEIELHLFLFHFYFLWSYLVLIWFIRNWYSNLFSCAFSMRLSKFYIHNHKVYELIRFNWSFFIVFFLSFFFNFSPHH